MNRVIIIFIAILLLISGYYFYNKMSSAYIRVEVKPNIDKELRDKATKSYLENRLQIAIKTNNLEDAKSYISLAKYLNIDLNTTLINEYKRLNEPINKHLLEAKSFIKGFISGKSSDGYSLAGSLTSDFTIVGDARDIYVEGGKYINNQPYNSLTLYLSIIGVALTATTIGSFGASAPIKSGVSILKSANKSRYLTRAFKENLIKDLSKSVDLKVLKEIDFHSISSIKNSSKKFINSINLKPIKSLAKDLDRLKENTSTIDAMQILKYIDNKVELKRAIKLSNRYKKNTIGIFKVLGKSAIRGSKFVLKKSAKYIYYLIGFIISIVGFFISLLIFLFKIK